MNNDPTGKLAVASQSLQMATGKNQAVCDEAVRLARGYVIRRQLAADKARLNVQALFELSEPLRELIADADYQHAAELICAEAIAAYERALVNL
jgi:hypothetical protein